MATRYNISVPKKYEKDGEEKTSWKTVGTLVRFPATDTKTEGYILELHMYPHTTFKVFPEKPKEDSWPEEKQTKQEKTIDISVPEEQDDNEPQMEDLPF